MVVGRENDEYSERFCIITEVMHHVGLVILFLEKIIPACYTFIGFTGWDLLLPLA
jgi:hypothetical protein